MQNKLFNINTPQRIIIIFLIILFICAGFMGISLKAIISDTLIRLAMNGILVLSLVPMLNAGIGINFGLPVGIVCGLLGMCCALNFKLEGYLGFGVSILFSIVFGILFGYIYSLIMNKAEGKEEITSTFIGFSFIPLTSIFWIKAPFTNLAMLYPIGGEGMRPKIGLEGYFKHVLNDTWNINIAGIDIPIGFILFFAIMCLLVMAFFKTKIGKAILAIGENKQFSYLAGIDVNKCKRISIIFSTVLGAIGICAYAQSYGFIELYNAPFMAAFPAASAILIGGNLGGKATIFEVVLGTYLYQSIYTISVPIANELLIPELAEIIRMIVTNAIILYAMFCKGRKRA